ncbi:MAG: hypothetical protein KDA47_08445, partial [Planctomycetales bacterium]|nr:hypothetical protein [Planctomycetales bacterium]
NGQRGKRCIVASLIEDVRTVWIDALILLATLGSRAIATIDETIPLQAVESSIAVHCSFPSRGCT